MSTDTQGPSSSDANAWFEAKSRLSNLESSLDKLGEDAAQKREQNKLYVDKEIGQCRDKLDEATKSTRKEIQDLRGNVDKLLVATGVLSTIVPLLVAAVVWRIILVPQNFTEEVGASKAARTTVAALALEDVETEIIAIMRHVPLARQSAEGAARISAVRERLDHVGKLDGIEDHDEYSMCRSLVEALQYVKSEIGERDDILDQLDDTANGASNPVRHRMLANIAIGLVHLADTKEEYSEAAFDAFERAMKLEQKGGGFRLGLVYNCRAVLACRKAAALEPSQAVVSLGVARRAFRESEQIDRTWTARRRSLNNVLNADLEILALYLRKELDVRVLVGLCRDRLGHEWYGKEPTVADHNQVVADLLEDMWDDMEQVLEASDRRNGHVLGTESLYWSVRGEWIAGMSRTGKAPQLFDETAEGCFAKSELCLRYAISNGLVPSGVAVDEACKMVDKPGRKAMMDSKRKGEIEGKTVTTERRTFVRQYLSQR